jgi:hypothetical protein
MHFLCISWVALQCPLLLLLLLLLPGSEGGASGASRELWVKALLRRAEAYEATPNKLDRALLVRAQLHCDRQHYRCGVIQVCFE